MTEPRHELRAPWSRSDRRIPRTIVRPLQEFLQTSSASALLLFGAVVVALVWVNSPWGGGYERLWTTGMQVHLGAHELGTDLRSWVNDGLMTFFFLLVGIEIKRELTTGELRTPRAAALPALAALGGMALPALLYVAVVHGGEGADGWGIPMATDIALALGALALAARHAPARLKPLLLTLAIVDDIGAILVIAIFYSHGGSGLALLGALASAGVVVALQRGHVRSIVPYAVAGAAMWLAVSEAGVHPTIAGVVLGLLTPSLAFQRPDAVSREAHRIADLTVDDPVPPDADAPAWLRLAGLSREAVSPLARVEHALLPWSSWVIVPVFALANAGVDLGGGAVRGALSSAVVLGIMLGLVIGKPLGVWLATYAAVHARVSALPPGVGWGDTLGLGATAGIGFTVALFIAELAFPDEPQLLSQAKVGILVASLVAGVAGNLLLRLSRSPEAPAEEAAG